MEFTIKFFELNEELKSFTNEIDKTLSIGRSSANDIVFANNKVSRNHAQLKLDKGKIYITDFSSNGTYVNNQRLESNVKTEIKPNDKIYFADESCFLKIKVVKQEDDNINQTRVEKKPSLSPTPPPIDSSTPSSALSNKPFIKIGRGDDCDVKLSDRTISRSHASLKDLGNDRYELTDLDSTNGTFYIGRRITKVTLNKGEKFIIGKYEFDTSGSYSRLDGRTVIRMQNISKKYQEKTVIHPLTLEIKPKTLTAIMGPSGCGKSTLLKMMNGIVKNTTGSISVFDLDLDKYYDYFKNQIGYVPQDDIVHLELTVFQSIYYAAKLRLEHLDDKKIENKINYLLKKLKIEKIKDNLNSAISGGQRKRVCIAIELLSDPMLLLLDEPTSPLDPQSIEEFMGILKDLTDSGTTVIMVTHKPDDLQFMDEVIFLTENGHVAYKGIINGSHSFFGVETVVEIYTLLTGNAAKKWESSSKNHQQNSISNKGEVQETNVNWTRQLYWLTHRGIKVKTNDSVNTWITILQAPIIAGLIGFIFKGLDLAVLFMAVISAIWFGVNNAAREIIKERAVFKRENLFNVYSSSYLFSKIIALSIISVIQTFLFVGVLSLTYSNSEVQLENFGGTFLWLFLVSMVSAMMGLMISAAMKSSDKVLALVPIILIPQLMLAGVITKIHSGIIEFLSYFTFSRWGTEGLAFIQENISLETPDNQTIEGDAVELLQANFHDSYMDMFDGGSLATDTIVLGVMGVVLIVLTYVFLRRVDG